jgi:hypothetical protein
VIGFILVLLLALYLYLGLLVWIIGMPVSRPRVILLWGPALCLSWRYRVRLV